MRNADSVAPVAPAKTTWQKIKPTGFPCLYRHENGSFYVVKKFGKTRKAEPLKTPAGEKISDRKLAERALLAWTDGQTTKTAASGKRMTFDGLLSEHMDTVKKLAGNTVRNYVWNEAKIKEGLAAKLTAPAETVTTLDCTKFLSSLPKAPAMLAASYNHVANYLNRVLKFGADSGIIPANPFDKVPKTLRKRKVVRDLPTVPTLEQFAAIVKEIRTVKHSDTREQTGDLVEFLGLAALGEAEAANLHWRDVDFEKDELRIQRKKTGKHFRVPFYPWLKTFLVALYERKGKPAGSEKVFDVVSSKKALEGACKRLSYPQFTARNLRQMGIIRLLRGGLNFKLVSKYQGHQDGGILIARTYSEVLSESDGDYERSQIAALK